MPLSASLDRHSAHINTRLNIISKSRFGSSFTQHLLIMLASISASTTPPIILDVASSNWASYKRQILRLLQTRFGKIGDSITNGIAPPLFVLPTRLDIDVNGAPIYSRVPLTAAQVADNVPLTANDLTPFGYDMLRDSIKRSLDQQIIDEKDDNDLLNHIFATMSPESHLSLETHSSYPAFRASLPTQKSFTCWALLSDNGCLRFMFNR